MFDEFNWLAHTKFFPPQLHLEILERPRLVRLLSQAVASRTLTLVSAPAGSGKTTLLASLPGASPHLAVAWLALDEEDNDPVRFLAGLVIALQQLKPGFGQSFLNLLTQTATPQADARRLVGLLINDIGQNLPQPLALVLDDLHIITEPGVYQILDYLLERLPSQARLLVATRHDPPLALARLRTRRQVAELRLADLRFTPDETGDFLGQKIGVDLSGDNLALLQARTEGWAAGISLAATFFENGVEQTGFFDSLAQTNRYIFDFLAQEILNRQSPERQDFLLQTSVLPELTPALCRAVTGQENSLAVLEELYRHNLFLRITDSATDTYRYHDLFRDFLQEQLKRARPNSIKELHRRAAQAETLPTRIMGHYLAGRLWEEAAIYLGQVGEAVLRQGSLDTLRNWLKELPVSVVEASPRLLLLQGKLALLQGGPGHAQQSFEKALAGFRILGDLAEQGETLALLSGTEAIKGDFEKSAVLAEEALQLPITIEQRVSLLTTKIVRLPLEGKLDQSWSALEECIHLAETTRDPKVIYEVVTALSGTIDGLPGGLDYLERLWQLLVQMSPAPGTLLDGRRLELATHLFLYRGDWDKAFQACLDLYALSDQPGMVFWLHNRVGAILPLCYAYRGADAKADYYNDFLFQGLEEVKDTPHYAVFYISFLFWAGRMRWHQGRFAELRRIAEQIYARKSDHEWPFAPYFRDFIEGMVAVSDGDYMEAVPLLLSAHKLQQTMDLTWIFGNTGLWLAYVYLKQRRPDEAIKYLEPVLARCERYRSGGFIMWEGPKLTGPLLRLAVARNVHASFARELLVAQNEPIEEVENRSEIPARILNGGETLTGRELEILRLVVKGRSNNEIAAELTLSLHTVKTHVGHILAKLEVASRAQAIARAHELNLL